MNITSQTLINQKIKHAKSLPFQSIQTSSSRLRLKEDRRFLNDKIKPFEIKTFKVKTVSFDMIYCPSGIFTMGADDKKNNPKRIEQIEHPFLLGETEVTQELYEAVMGYNPIGLQTNGAQRPIGQVSWYDAVMFCNKLSQMLGKMPYYLMSGIKEREGSIYSAFVQINENSNGFRLPTEKEWEYAAKAGTNNQWAGCDNERDLDKYGRYYQNSNNSTQPVKTLLPNEWGFYDMSGNVFEWCWDKIYPKDNDPSADRVYRGGGWINGATGLRSAARSSISPGTCSADIGFRVSASLVN